MESLVGKRVIGNWGGYNPMSEGVIIAQDNINIDIQWENDEGMKGAISADGRLMGIAKHTTKDILGNFYGDDHADGIGIYFDDTEVTLHETLKKIKDGTLYWK